MKAGQQLCYRTAYFTITTYIVTYITTYITTCIALYFTTCITTNDIILYITTFAVGDSWFFDE